MVLVGAMSYYSVVSSLSELAGDKGLLRLPQYIRDVFVMDESRRRALSLAIAALRRGERVIIEGEPGTGKTALMFMVLGELAGVYRIGYIREGATSIGNEHVEEGVIVFYDDIPRMNTQALKSIIKNNVRGIISTARSEELVVLGRILGINISDYFYIVKIEPLSEDKIRDILLKHLQAEAIKVVDREAIDIIAKKALGLPVYVWHVVRELKIRKKDLTVDFAREVPEGMLDYVDTILWRVLGGREERYEALLTLLCMTDFLKYEIHQDLYNYVYLVAKEERLKTRLEIHSIVTDTVFYDLSRYLARQAVTYTYRLPHDVWADVLRGKSNGPMAPEIATMNIVFKNCLLYTSPSPRDRG